MRLLAWPYNPKLFRFYATSFRWNHKPVSSF